MICVGCDPGSKTSGVVLRDGDKVVEWELIEREDGESIDHYARVVALVANSYGAELVAVENVRPMGRVHRRPLIETAIIVGWTLALADRFVLLEPNHYGSGPLLSFPRELVGDHEQKGTGERRHLRSAWSIAGAAMLEAEVAASLDIVHG